MSQAELDRLAAQVSQLRDTLLQDRKTHEKEINALWGNFRDAQKRLVTHYETNMREGEESMYVRRIEWIVEQADDKVKNTPKNERLWSPEFAAGGVKGMKLEFFPTGRDTKEQNDGYCGLFLWCPPGVRLKYQLSLGSYFGSPDDDMYDVYSGHGHSRFCPTRPEIDPTTDTVTVGLTIHEIETVQNVAEGLVARSECPEMILSRAANIFYTYDCCIVEWTVKDVMKRMQMPCGIAISSPLFTIAGSHEAVLDLYPTGLSAKGSGREGYCALYVRCPNTVLLMVTLSVGRTKKGPILTEFKNTASRGVPDFCRLEDEVVDGVVKIGLVMTRTDNDPSTQSILTIES